mgnify:CR=1 FL=1
MGYNEFDELGDKIQSIIDSAVNEKITRTEPEY